MEINVISKTKKKLVFELKGEDHTFCNLLRDELWNVKGVVTSGYNIKHPLVGIPRFIVETESGTPQEALEAAAKAIKKKSDDFAKQFAKM